MKAKNKDIEKILADELNVGDYFVYNENTYRCICKHNGSYITGQSIDGSEEDMEYYYVTLSVKREVYVTKRERRWLVQEFDEDKDLMSEELFVEREDAYNYMLSFVRFMGELHKQEDDMEMDLEQLEKDYNNSSSFMETNGYGHYGRYMTMSELTTHTQGIEYS